MQEKAALQEIQQLYSKGSYSEVVEKTLVFESKFAASARLPEALNLKGLALKYKGKYHASMCHQLGKAMADVGPVWFAYDAQRRGYKRPVIEIDGKPMWID